MNARRLWTFVSADYATEIPFHKKPAPGFYDGSGESAEPVAAEEFLGTKGRGVMEMDYGGKRRNDIEAALKKADLSHTKVSVGDGRHRLHQHCTEKRVHVSPHSSIITCVCVSC